MNSKNQVYGLLAILLIAALACNAPTTTVQPNEPQATQAPLVEQPNGSEEPVAVTHLQTPATDVPKGALVKDVESSGTGPQKRAPYGDSYDINLLERPFLKDMTYVPDLDISSFNISQDDIWHYVSIKMIGLDPNNAMGIDFAVELDTNKDGFGDFIIWAQPPYATDWGVGTVQVFADGNHDTSGLAANKSDAPISTDGYETLLFDGAKGVGDDPDLAWVRMADDGTALVQFAFKRSWSGDVFMLGVLADAGLKDVAKLDYVDRFKQADAGSPVKDKQYYPLQALFAVDNTCRQAIGFASTGYEPMSCLKNVPQPGPGNNTTGSPPQAVCADPQYSEASCSAQGLYYWPPPHCACSTVPYTP